MRDAARIRAALERELLTRSFADYVRKFWPVVTGRELEPNRAIDEAVAVLQRVADGELHRVLIAMPSGVGKSTLLVLWAGWRLARNPAHRAIHMSHAYDLAATQSRRIRRLVEGAEHRAFFPSIRLREDESTVAAWATTADGRFFAVGRDSALLGRRAHEAVLDDPADVTQRFSRAEKEALWLWFEESLMTRLDGDRAPVIVVHQRTGLDDLIGKLATQRDGNGEPVWHYLALPAEDDEGNLLAPTILTREKLDEIKQRNPRVYRAMFLQRPDADDGAGISRAAWRFHAPAGANPLAPRPMGCISPEDSPTVETPEHFENIVISVDPTFGGTKTANDYCSIQVWGAVGRNRYLLARWKRKAKQLAQRAQVKAFRAEYPGARVLIEKSAGGAGMIEELEAEGVRDVEAVTVGTLTGGKAARLENVSPTIEQGFAYLLVGMHDLAGFVDDLAGAALHDDDMDACSQAIHALNIQQGRPIPEPAAPRCFYIDEYGVSHQVGADTWPSPLTADFDDLDLEGLL